MALAIPYCTLLFKQAGFGTSRGRVMSKPDEQTFKTAFITGLAKLEGSFQGSFPLNMHRLANQFFVANFNVIKLALELSHGHVMRLCLGL